MLTVVIFRCKDLGDLFYFLLLTLALFELTYNEQG